MLERSGPTSRCAPLEFCQAESTALTQRDAKDIFWLLMSIMLMLSYSTSSTYRVQRKPTGPSARKRTKDQTGSAQHTNSDSCRQVAPTQETGIPRSSWILLDCDAGCLQASLFQRFEYFDVLKTYFFALLGRSAKSVTLEMSSDQPCIVSYSPDMQGRLQDSAGMHLVHDWC